MNEKEWNKWVHDANIALGLLYSTEDTAIIIDWFSRIKTRKEIDLVGEEVVEAASVFICAKDNFNVYNSLMARLFIYAPLILKDYK